MNFTENIPDFTELKQNYSVFQAKLNPVISELKSTTDFKSVRDKLILLQLEFRNLKFNREDREELYSIIQEAFAVIHTRIEVERAQFEKDAFQNYAHLKDLVENAIFASSKETDPRQAKSYLIEAQAGFKGARLIKEQREELYNKLQKEFDRVNVLLEADKAQFSVEAETNYSYLKPLIEGALHMTESTANFQESKEQLITIQNEFRGRKLIKEHREQLYQKLQDAFTILNLRLSEERENNRHLADDQYPVLKKRAEDLLQFSGETSDFRTAREQLKALQFDLRESKLFKDQKDTVYQLLQEVFVLLNLRQDQDRKQFEDEAIRNYNELGKLVEHGLAQAQETTEYKETREYLKKIQAEFRGRRMVKEQREELYSRLQTSFDVLNKRVDTFFREKKKNWEVKMQFRANDLQATIMELNQRMDRDLENLRELETQLENIGSGGREYEAKERLMAKILSVQNSIRKNTQLIRSTEEEAVSIKKRLEDPEEE